MCKNHIIQLQAVSSTNQYAAELLLKEKIEEGTVICAFKQYSGRGSIDNIWESEDGKNLTVTFIFYPEFLPAAKQHILNKAAALAIHDMLSQILDGEKNKIKIKWPNDIYIDHKKVSGLLIENSFQMNCFTHTIIGIGININQKIFLSNARNPVSLTNITGITYNLNECLLQLFKCMNTRYKQLKALHYNLIDEDYLSALYEKGIQRSYKKNGQLINATIIGVNNFGKLLLEMENSELNAFDFKELEMEVC